MAENYLVTPQEQYAETADPYPGLLSDVPNLGKWASEKGVVLDAPAPFFKSALEEAHEAHRRQSRVFQARAQSGMYAEGKPEGEAFPYISPETGNQQVLVYCLTAGTLGLVLYAFFTGRSVVG